MTSENNFLEKVLKRDLDYTYTYTVPAKPVKKQPQEPAAQTAQKEYKGG